jgi:hypothetical protein
VVIVTLRPLYPRGKNSRYPLDRRLGGLQSRCGRGGEEEKSQLLPGIEPRSLVTILTELPRLLIGRKSYQKCYWWMNLSVPARVQQKLRGVWFLDSTTCKCMDGHLIICSHRKLPHNFELLSRIESQTQNKKRDWNERRD